MEINWKDYIKMPLKEDTFSDSLIKVYTAEHEMAFDFPMYFSYKHEEMIHLSYEMKKSFLQLINGEEVAPFTHQYKLTYNPNNTIIYADDKLFIIIRGWGHLTGSGGLGLDDDTAVAIQTGFANHIIESLNKYRVYTKKEMITAMLYMINSGDFENTSSISAETAEHYLKQIFES